MGQLIKRVGVVEWSVLLLLISQVELGWGNETSQKSHGPNANPTHLGTNSVGLRNRFPNKFQQKDASPTAGGGGVKILEALSARVQKVLKGNPALLMNNTGGHATEQKVERRMGSVGDYEEGEEAFNETEESDEVLLSTFGKPVFTKRSGGGYGNVGPSLPAPVYSNVVGPPSPSVYGNRPRPTVITYKPGGHTMKPMVFPPMPTPSPGGGIEPPPVTDGPQPTPSPVGPTDPPSPTIVPIIGGSPGGNGGGEDIFPPSPPEIESVGRSLNTRQRMSNSKSQNSREGKSTAGMPVGLRRGGVGTPGNPGKSSTGLTRSNGGAPGSPGGTASSSRGSSGGNSGGRLRTTRLRDKVRESLEEMENSEVDANNSREDPENSVDSDVITDFAFEDIKCFKTRTKEYFGATIHMKRGFHPPYVRDRPQDPLTSNDCRMELKPGTKSTFHMTVTDLRGCGVEQCGDFMCLTMVFPRVPTLALADDEVTTIKCLPQKSTMADTRTISFAGDTLENRKSSSTVEGGGQDFAAEVGVFRQNPGTSNSLFVKRVNSGGVVQLGEPLQLRSIVRGGDGWKHSRLSEVKVWRMRDAAPASNVDNLDPNDASEVITLVDGRGCRNDEYNVIAESHPLKDPRNDLVNHFTFKAFLFRGQRANEPLILTAKVHACQEDLDCILDDCESSSGRKKRSPIELHNSSAIIHDWNSKMALRVVGLQDQSTSLSEEDFPMGDYGSKGRSMGDEGPPTCAEKMAASGLGGGLIVLLLCGIALALYAYTIKGRETRRMKPVGFSSGMMEGMGGGGAMSRMNPGQPPQQVQQMHQQQQMIPPGFPEGPKMNKPLPPTPSNNNGGESIGNSSPEPDHLSKAELSSVAKMLQKMAQKTSSKPGSKPQLQEQTDYECIDETSTKKQKKGDNGVYIVYCCNDDKAKGLTKRPKSAPGSLRDKRRQSKKDKNRKKASPDIYSSPQDSPTSETPSESTEDSDESSSSSDPNNNSRAFANRRTVRSVKTRRGGRGDLDNHHSSISHNRSASERKHNKVVSGIRRRLSSFYRENAKLNQIRSGYNKSRGSTKDRRRSEMSDGTVISSDLDSAYYGSEFNDDVLQEMRQLAAQHQQAQMNQQKELVANVKQQLRNSGGVHQDDGHPLEPGQTKAAHFVTRNDKSTKILIVPETHV